MQNDDITGRKLKHYDTTSLTKLYCNYNKIRKINFNNLIVLECKNNRIKEVKLLLNISIIFEEKNKIKDYSYRPIKTFERNKYLKKLNEYRFN